MIDVTVYETGKSYEYLQVNPVLKKMAIIFKFTPNI
jgi:hypothetical protein